MAGMVVRGVVVSDVGCQRELNEDSARLVQPVGGGRGGALAVIADGMGGHAAGDLASAMAVDVISQHFAEMTGDPGRQLQVAVSEANRRVFETAVGDNRLHGMGTTCTALVLDGWQAHVAHIGDSRLYLLRGGDIYLLTEDDSAVMEMVRQGLLTREQARTHDEKNVILKALGTRSDVAASMWPEPLPVRDGDRFVLSTDGLHDLVEDHEIADHLTTGELQAACGGLVELARRRGGPDNITLMALEVSSATEPYVGVPGITRVVEGGPT